MKRIVVGLVEKVKIEGREVVARIDTGAQNNSISQVLAKELGLGPVIKTILVKSSNGKQIRPIVEANLELGGKKMKTTFNITDRSHMRYQVLIGQKALKEGFLIDPSEGE